MDKPVTTFLEVEGQKYEVSIPLPIMPVIEDVGWWRGEDGSAWNQPYRNAFPRDHCPSDYLALLHFARMLRTRPVVALVMGEWDRTDFLATIPEATWMGEEWNNGVNIGPWLDQAAESLRTGLLELAIHGICHEFWGKEKMERTEFHDSSNIMRSEDSIRSHLDGFMELLVQNGLESPPRIFVPPALRHSFGNGEQSIQAILAEYGVRYVITDFSRARQYSPPHHPHLSWEEGVILLDRGQAPVGWNERACKPQWDGKGVVLPLHWGNLLHPDPEQSLEVVEGWAEMLLAMGSGLARMIAKDVDSCVRQAAACWFAGVESSGHDLLIDLSQIPLASGIRKGPVETRIRCQAVPRISCLGGTMRWNDTSGDDNIHIVMVEPAPGENLVRLRFT